MPSWRFPKVISKPPWHVQSLPRNLSWQSAYNISSLRDLIRSRTASQKTTHMESKSAGRRCASYCKQHPRRRRRRQGRPALCGTYKRSTIDGDGRGIRGSQTVTSLFYELSNKSISNSILIIRHETFLGHRTEGNKTISNSCPIAKKL